MSFSPGGQVPGSAGGGGGAALGGAIFVRSDNGASIQFLSTTEVASHVHAGTAGSSPAGNSHAILSAATDGQALGGAIFLPSGTTVFQGNSNLGSAITGGSDAALEKSGSGTLTLTGENTYGGGTTITGGTLQIGSNGTTGSLSGDIPSLTFFRSDDYTFAGAISGSGTLAKEGAGMLTLTGANTYTGTTTITDGTLVAANDQAVGFGTVSVDGGVFLIQDGVTISNAVSVSGGAFHRVLAGGANLANSNNATAAMRNFQGSFAAFQIAYGSALSNYIGAWGVDLTGGGTSAWAVVNHNSDFAVVPEPATAILFGLGLLALGARFACQG